MKSNMASKLAGEKRSEAELVGKLQDKLAASRDELQSMLEIMRVGEERYTRTEHELQQDEQELVCLNDEACNTEEMINDLVVSLREQDDKQESMKQMMEKCIKELADKKETIIEYELQVIEKNIGNEELLIRLEAITNCVASSNTESHELTEDLSIAKNINEENGEKLERLVANENEWKALAKLLQEQLDEKNVDFDKFDGQVSLLKSRLSSCETEYADKEEQEAVLKESLEIIKDSSEIFAEADGWEVDDSLKVDRTEKIAQLRSDIESASSLKEVLEIQLVIVESKTNDALCMINSSNPLIENLKKEKAAAENNCIDIQCKIDVLADFFNRKEIELQRQLGQQTSLFGETSTDAANIEENIEKATAELKEATSHLEITKKQLQRSDNEQKLKVSEQEQEAHKNWMVAKQAERRLLEMEEEMTVLKSRLVVVNTIPKSAGPSGSSCGLLSLPGMPSLLPSLPGMPSPLPLLPGMPIPLPSLPGMPSPLPSLPGMPSDFSSLPGIPNDMPSFPGSDLPSLPGMPCNLSTPSFKKPCTPTPGLPGMFSLSTPSLLPPPPVTSQPLLPNLPGMQMPNMNNGSQRQQSLSSLPGLSTSSYPSWHATTPHHDRTDQGKHIMIIIFFTNKLL